MSFSRFVPRLAAVTGGLVLQGALLTTPLGAQALDSATTAGLRWRTVGPANFMGRLSDVVGIPSPSKTVFVAAARGGIWNCHNNGSTWRPLEEHQQRHHLAPRLRRQAHHLHGDAGDCAE
jgi:hypothetical protein